MTGYLAILRREMDADAFESAPNEPAVFLLWAEGGAPYLARTGLLRRRLTRLLRRRENLSRVLNLSGVVRRIEWYPTASRLESSYVLYSLARRHYPDDWERILRLRNYAYIRLTLSNRFPRATVTTRIGAGRSSYFGPFRNRATAEAFQGQMLDLFQIRRCQEDLEPRSDHPGCIYGEMNMCLRPCQEIVGAEEYVSEVARVQGFLSTAGTSLIEVVSAARDRFSEEMQFEEAARQHRRLQKIEEVLRLRDELARDTRHLFGIAVTPSREPEAVVLWFMQAGSWHEPVCFSMAVEDGKPISLDHKLRETILALPDVKSSAAERQQHMALLAKWFYSSWRDGEWLPVDDWLHVPYRRLVNAVGRVARQATSSK